MCLGAYGVWGLMPLYWTLLRRVASIEILAHRVAWSLVVLLLTLSVTGKLRTFWNIPARKIAGLACAAVLIEINWGVYIWAVNHGRVVETALGYFVNPLVTVMFGVVFFGEHLRRIQWAAIALATVAVAVLTANYGRVPWVAAVLAASFATYGLLKKKVGLGAVESLAIETSILGPVAVAYLVFREANRTAASAHLSTTESVLLAFTGILTTVPLLCFAGAANRVSFTTLGLMQYLSPSLQFLLGIFVFGEAMPPARWAGFALVWCALALFALDLTCGRRRAAASLPARADR